MKKITKKQKRILTLKQNIMSIKIHFEGVFNDPGAETVAESLTKRRLINLSTKPEKGMNSSVGWIFQIR